MSGPVYIRIDRPEEYDDVADELLIEDWIGCLKAGGSSGGFDWRQVAAPVDITDEMVEAARAIAALPHLIEALRLFVGENTTHTDTERIAAGRAALALL